MARERMTRGEFIQYFLPTIRRVVGNELIHADDIKDIRIGRECSIFAGETLVRVQVGDLTAFVAIPDKRVFKLPLVPALNRKEVN